MRSFTYAAVVAALTSAVAGQATQQQCAALRCPAAVTQANPSGTTPPAANANANSAGYFGCAATADAFYTALGNARTSGINGISTNAAATDAACLAACQGTTGCAGYFFNPAAITNPTVAANTCYIFSQQGAQNVLQAIQNTPYAAGAGNDVQFYCPPISSSSIAPASSSAPIVGASSSVAAVATSAPVVASTSLPAGVSVVSSAAPAASSGAVSASSNGPSCPSSNLLIFSAQTASGVSAFNIVCGAGTVGKRAALPAPIAKRQFTGPLNAFGICITACANVATCQSVLFNPLNGACVLFNCIIPVPAGLSGAVRVTTAGGAPFVGQACPAAIPTTIPAGSLPAANSTAPVFNININVNVNVLAGEYKGVPYTQICDGKCDPCDVCTKKPVTTCSVCEQKGKPAPLKPSTSYCPPGVPGKPGFPGTCTTCQAETTPAKPDYSSPSKPAKSGSDTSYPSKSSPDYSASTGKYTGPYSNDAAGLNAMSALIGGAAALAFALA